MVMTARTVTPEQLELLQGGGYLDDEPGVDVDKAWHAIHWLLTGTGAERPPAPRAVPPKKKGLFRRSAPEPPPPTPPAGPEWLAVLGGEPIDDEDTRVLHPDQVAAVAAALEPLTPELLGARMDLRAMEEEALYPQIWDEPDVYETYIGPNYAALRQFYLDAAARGAIVVLAIR